MYPVKDIDTGNSYDSFQTNIDVESRDSSSVLVVLLDNEGLKNASLLAKLSGDPGLKEITEEEGILYNKFLKANQFNPTNENTFVTILESLLKNATQVYFFGQVYHDTDGEVGIHDIHRITTKGYGDGAFLTVDSAGNYYGVFSHFQDQYF